MKSIHNDDWMMKHRFSPTPTIQDQVQLEVELHLSLDRGLQHLWYQQAFVAVDSFGQTRFFLFASQLQNWPIPPFNPP